MKIVQLNTVCGIGSTGKIAVDLYHVAAQAGHTSFIAYGRNAAPDNLQSFKIGTPFDFVHHVLINFFLGKSGFGSKTVTKRFLQWLDKANPDIIHLHNLHGFYIHVGMLFEYIKAHNIPVVWTLHDCWPLTGQCAYFDYARCDKWKTSCHHCPIYRTDYPYSLFCDNSHQNYIMKRNAFTDVKDMTIVTPSTWLANLVKKSYLKNYPVAVIPNGIDLELFKPASDTTSKTHLMNACPLSPRIILGVANGWSKRKGLDFFLQLSDMLDSSYHIVLIGLSKRQKTEIQTQYGKHITGIIRTSDQAELVSWYQHAYVYVNPTLEDNFPTTNLEALACGTPVITFNTGGSPESITDHCGIVVEKGNVAKLKEAILSLEQKTKITPLSCREHALEFGRYKQFSEYLKLYQTLKLS